MCIVTGLSFFGYDSVVLCFSGGSIGNFKDLLMTFANSLNPDEAQQNVGPHLGSKLFDIYLHFGNNYRQKC